MEADSALNDPTLEREGGKKNTRIHVFQRHFSPVVMNYIMLYMFKGDPEWSTSAEAAFTARAGIKVMATYVLQRST